MCGIVGLTDRENFPSIYKMNELISHRGPDDSGLYIDEYVAIAMRRLAIIDLEHGRQPMSNEDDSIWVVCNGEIYNSPLLRKRLEKKGHKFKTKNSDVETLLHLYEEEGVDMVKRLNGMYAFVIYDKRRGILFGVRDRVGIKPLYYSFKNGKFAFASELKCLLLLPWITKNLNFESLYHYISFRFIPAPGTIFRDVNKLPAGHFFVYDLSKQSFIVRKYWELDVNSIDWSKSVDEWIELLKSKIAEAVKRWTLSDVPIACSLSGGLDSSSLVGFLSQSGIGKLTTYSLGFTGLDEQYCNELPLAGLVAKKYGTEHKEVILNVNRILEDIAKMVWHLDEPYGGGLPSWYIYEAAKKDGIKVILTGTGGDELFGNYAKYIIYEKPHFYKIMRVGEQIAKFKLYKDPNLFSKEIRNFLANPVGYLYWKYFSDAFKDEIIFSSSGIIEDKRKTEFLLRKIWQRSGARSPRNAVAFIDFQLQLPEEFLLVTDKFSMAHSVEARVPFLDHELVELVFKLPPKIRTGWNEPKSFFKNIVKELLPEELLSAPKRGFILPLDAWIRNQLSDIIKAKLSPSYLERQGIFSPKIYQYLVKPHFEGVSNYTPQIWTLFMFQLWYEIFMEGGNYA